MVGAGAGVWAQDGFRGKDEGLVVHGGKPLAAGTRLHKRTGRNLNEVLFRRVGVFDCPKTFIKGPVCVRRECEAVGRVVISGEAEWFDMGGLDHDGSRGGGEGATCESAGEGVAREDFVAESCGTAGLPGGLSFLRIGISVLKDVDCGETKCLGQR